MADVETVAPHSAVAGGVAPPPGSEQTREQRTRELVDRHVKAAQSAQAAEAAAELDQTPVQEDSKSTQPQRDPTTGKFLKAGEKPAGDDKPKAEPKPETKKDPEVSGGLGKARRLASEGKVAEALEMIGLAADKIPHGVWKSWRVNNEKVATALAEQRQAVDRDQAEVQRVARELTSLYEPLANAKKAYEQGDYEQAFKLAFGEELNSFQRKALQRMSNPGLDKDPAITALRNENAEIKRLLQEQVQQQKESAEKQQASARRESLWNGMVESLKSSDDPRIASIAEKRSFQDRVWKELGKHYDQKTDSTLPPTEAAELVIAELEELGMTFGASKPRIDETRDRVASRPATTDQGRTPARRPAKAATSLSTSEAAEAAPAQKLRGRPLLDKYIREAELAVLREQQNT